MLRQLLLLPCLAPLLAVLLVAALNPRPAINLRLLIWSSPALPLGMWLALAAGGDGMLSALGTGLALRGSSPGLQRQVRRPAAGRQAAPEPWEPAAPSPAAGAGPGRPAGEPSPTVEVPYRVIRRGRPTPERSAREASRVPVTATASGGMASSGDDGWDQPLPEDW